MQVPVRFSNWNVLCNPSCPEVLRSKTSFKRHHLDPLAWSRRCWRPALKKWRFQLLKTGKNNVFSNQFGSFWRHLLLSVVQENTAWEIWHQRVVALANESEQNGNKGSVSDLHMVTDIWSSEDDRRDHMTTVRRGGGGEGDVDWQLGQTTRPGRTAASSCWTTPEAEEKSPPSQSSLTVVLNRKKKQGSDLKHEILGLFVRFFFFYDLTVLCCFCIKL